MSPDRVIGRGGALPWRRPADLRRFKALTMGGTLVMGRRTFASIGRPLPGRDNVVLTARELEGVETVSDLDAALERGTGPLWIIGGARVFAAALDHSATDFVDLTHVPDPIPPDGSVLFPRLDPETWVAGQLAPSPEDPELWHQRFDRRS
jgi:dihydrofolate reductase